MRTLTLSGLGAALIFIGSAFARPPSGPLPGCSDGQVIIYQSSGAPTYLGCGTLGFSNISGSVAAAQMPALTGDITTSAGAVTTTLSAGSATNLNAGTIAAARMPALTGDVTTSAGSVATSIGSGKVTSGMLASQSFVVSGFHSFCTGGSMAASSTVFMPGLGGVATTCTGLGTSRTGGTAVGTGTIKNLRVNLGTGGKANDAVTVEIAGVASPLTCTFGTGTSCSDTSHSAAVTAGQVLTVKVTTGSSETAANIAVYFELWN